MSRAALALAWLLAVGPGIARGSAVTGRQSVLVLHSYSQDFVWTRSQQQGVDAVFGPLAAEYDVWIDYLDAIHHPGLLKGRIVADLLRAKLSDHRFRVVMTSDNAALDFARAHRAELFPGVPIVFMGVNGWDDSMLRAEAGITGVAEDPNLRGTIDVLLRLRPETKRIVFPGMTDDITYRASRPVVERFLPTLPPHVAVEFPEYPHVDAALEALRTLPPEAAIVIMTNMRTQGGEGISSQRVVELVSAAAPVPVFTSWDFVVGHGAVGGSVTSGVEQGRLAAELAVRILRGERPESIPVHRGAGNAFVFDHRQLERFGIPRSRLPPGAVVLFSPERALRIPREAAWIAGSSLAVLLALGAWLSARRIRESEARYRRFVDTSHEGIWALGPDQRITFANARMAEMLGTSPEALAGKAAAGFLPPEDAEADLRRLEARTRREPELFQLRLRRADGRVVSALAAVTPVFDKAGRFQGSFAMLTDITERVRAEGEVRALNEELRQRVGELTERTAQLETANVEMSDFFYTLSHDLRAPLRHIGGHVELLRRSVAVPDEQSRHHLDVVGEAARRMGTLIDDLLSFSRMGRAELSRERVDLGALAKEVVAERDREAPGREVSWRIGALPAVTGDRAMLKTVLVNLVSNALKFTRAQAQARIEIGAREAGAGEIVVFVRDNGVGFDPRFAHKLFGVFQRLHRAEEFEGTGIGLAIVRRIIARHGGRTWAEGAVGEGATVFFSLPGPVGIGSSGDR